MDWILDFPPGPMNEVQPDKVLRVLSQPSPAELYELQVLGKI